MSEPPMTDTAPENEFAGFHINGCDRRHPWYRDCPPGTMDGLEFIHFAEPGDA